MNPFKLYVRGVKAQWRWMAKHPVQWLVLNVVATAVVVVVAEYADRRFQEKLVSQEADLYLRRRITV